MSEQTAKGRATRKMRTGVVVSDKMTETVTVQLQRQLAHPLYGKQIRLTKRVKAHDTHGANAGDKVRIMETRPMSKTKRWRVVEILKRAQ